MQRTERQCRTVHLRRSGFLGIRHDECQMVFKWADTLNELEQAFSLVYEEYLRSGYITEPNSSKVFFNFHNLLPSSSTLVAKKENKVVATLSMVFDSEDFGLPADSLYRKELAPLRKRMRKLGEICTLAIAPEFRLGNLIMPMFKSVYRRSLANSIDDLCIMVHPKHSSFYQLILLFEQLGPERIYPRVGAPAVCLRGDVKSAAARAQEAYRGIDELNNVWEYFKPDQSKTKSERQAGVDDLFNPFTARYFLVKEKKLLSTLRPKEFDFLLPVLW